MIELSEEQLKKLIEKINNDKVSSRENVVTISQACQKAIDQAQKENIYLTFATLDQAGQLNFLYRHSNSLPISLELAQKKAYSAFAMQKNTISLQPLTQPGAILYQLESSTNGKIVTFGGGIWLGKETIFSAIGVSGASDPLDDHRFAELFWDFYQKEMNTENY